MKSWVELVYNSCKVFILFTGCTLLFYFGMVWVSGEYQDYKRYDEPSGSAVKVMQMNVYEDQTWIERLFMFYHNGE
ncbi:YqzK family protein [Priestia flexa]|uniref:YqzK family protein n=1 Tax=Priestia flexa TaxID=86664 RepID=UPI002E1D3240|nr:YqzK family protein [Priestia flexa]